MTLERVQEILTCRVLEQETYELARLAEERLLLEQMFNFSASHGQRWHFNGATEDTLGEAIRKAAGIK